MENQTIEPTKVKAPLFVVLFSVMGLLSAIILCGAGIMWLLAEEFLIGTIFIVFGITIFIIAQGLRKMERSALLLYVLATITGVAMSVLLKLLEDVSSSSSSVGLFFSMIFCAYLYNIRDKFSGSYTDKKFFAGVLLLSISLILQIIILMS